MLQILRPLNLLKFSRSFVSLILGYFSGQQAIQAKEKAVFSISPPQKKLFEIRYFVLATIFAILQLHCILQFL